MSYMGMHEKSRKSHEHFRKRGLAIEYLIIFGSSDTIVDTF